MAMIPTREQNGPISCSVERVKAAATFETVPGALRRIGLIVLANDPVCEIECATHLPSPEVTLHVARIPHPQDFSLPALAQLEPAILRAVATILPADRLDCVALGCASAASAIGRDRLKERVRQTRPGLAFTDPGMAAIRVLKASQTRRISLLLTPTDSKTNAAAVHFYVAAGFVVLRAKTLGLQTEKEMATMSLTTLEQALVEVDHPEADAILVPCTALRTWLVISRLSQALGRPILTGNRALMLDAITASGRPLPGALS